MMCDSPHGVADPRNPGQTVGVPCGRCPPCRQNRVNGWVFRMRQQDKVSKTAYFVTLTYDTRHVPITPGGFMTLDKRDCQLWMKRLRKFQPKQKIKYYLVGEYGSENSRPHYHVIIFDVLDTDFLSKAWEMGDVHIGRVSGASIAYTCKYIDKPTKVPAHQYDDRLKEFSLMSKGMGLNYLTPQMAKYHLDDLSRMYCTTEEGMKIPMPKYYKNKLFTADQRLQQQDIIEARLGYSRTMKAEEVKRLYDGRIDVDKYEDYERIGRYHRDADRANPRKL